MNFWQRLFFPKTAQLLDLSESLRQKDVMIQQLVDAVVKGRGEMPVFQAEKTGKPVIKASNSISGNYEAWQQNETLKENEQIIQEAFESEESYYELYGWALDGRPGADELLREVDRRIASVPVEEAGVQ